MREAEDKEGLFIVEELSKNDTIAFVDLRSGSFSIYAYAGDKDSGQQDIDLDNLRPFPDCVTSVKAEVNALGNQSLANFSKKTGDD